MSTKEKPLVLVVDDEEDFLEIMTAKLRASGFDAEVAKNSKEAIAQAEKLKPGPILMDIHMPGGTGTDAALTIKQNPKTKGIKIAFLTSVRDPWLATSADKKKLAKALGMEDFLEKTEDLDSSIGKIRGILRKGE